MNTGDKVVTIDEKLALIEKELSEVRTTVERLEKDKEDRDREMAVIREGVSSALKELRGMERSRKLWGR